MSLLTSLARASASFLQATEQRGQATPAAGTAPAAKAPEQASGKRDGDVTLNGGDLPKAWSRLAVKQYKTDVGQDSAFVKETLRHKLAEYNLNPATRVGLEKSADGRLSLSARLPENTRVQIEQDLNNNKPFREAFSRLSVNEPTLAFVDTAVKLNRAYGVSNPLLDTLVSENQQFNGLQDLVHRYDSLRRTVSSEQVEAAGGQRGYAFSFNAQA
ncbi:MAG: hypothetical protein R3280_03160 [Marinobacter sp.]|uniref:hypothetical protein n=1 Tax=Marinobacter sp. TaxID=50741 RepID=UPI00299F2167|nr:hypothetical protein [Marinobacter sp.]MDX1633614.1 hypothetical protein [Marinobacter sp.]